VTRAQEYGTQNSDSPEGTFGAGDGVDVAGDVIGFDAELLGLGRMIPLTPLKSDT